MIPNHLTGDMTKGIRVRANVIAGSKFRFDVVLHLPMEKVAYNEVVYGLATYTPPFVKFLCILMVGDSDASPSVAAEVSPASVGVLSWFSSGACGIGFTALFSDPIIAVLLELSLLRPVSLGLARE